jgi:arsenite methyltransferase
LISDMMARDLPPELLALPAAYSSCVAGAISEEEYVTGLRAAGVTDVEVRGRLVYDAGQIAAYAETVTDDPGLRNRLNDYVRSLEGKVWSAKVYGRKPA